MKLYRLIVPILILTLFAVSSTAFAAEKVKPRKCIMVFGAHADDVEIMAGGAFAKYISEGYEGIYVNIINNTAGCLLEKAPGKWDFIKKEPIDPVFDRSKTFPPDGLEQIQMRTEEARKGAAVFGAEIVFLNFCELVTWQGRYRLLFGTEQYYKYDPPGKTAISIATRHSDQINVFVELFEKYQPEITIMHTMGGEKHDHGNSGYITYQAFKKAMSKGIPVGKLWMHPDGWLLDDEARNSGRGEPDVIIDVTEANKIKYKALNQHLSQNGGTKGWDVVPGKKYEEKYITVINNME